jgi:hypothetical protein
MLTFRAKDGDLPVGQVMHGAVKVVQPRIGARNLFIKALSDPLVNSRNEISKFQSSAFTPFAPTF